MLFSAESKIVEDVDFATTAKAQLPHGRHSFN
jgi:hypothetical protein